MKCRFKIGDLIKVTNDVYKEINGEIGIVKIVDKPYSKDTILVEFFIDLFKENLTIADEEILTEYEEYNNLNLNNCRWMSCSEIELYQLVLKKFLKEKRK